MPASSKSKYQEQFRRDVVELAHSSDRPSRRMAREPGDKDQALRNWVHTAEAAQTAPAPSLPSWPRRSCGRCAGG